MKVIIFLSDKVIERIELIDTYIVHKLVSTEIFMARHRIISLHISYYHFYHIDIKVS